MPEAPRLLRFSTEMLPERERFSAFREEFARKVLAMDVVDHSAGRARVDITFMPLGQVAVGSLVTSPVEFIRDDNHLRDGSDDLRLDIVAAGHPRYTHAGLEHWYGPGSACLSHHARAFRGFGRSTAVINNITARVSDLRRLVANPEDLPGKVVRPGPGLSLLDGYLRSLAAIEEPLSAELARRVGTHLLDLLAAVLGPIADAKELIAGRGVRAARLRAVLSRIARRFNDPNFNLDAIAAELGLSRRYVQLLLEETGKSFTDRLVERRLERSYAMLTDPSCLHMRVTDVALEVGFSDVSHFNRMFRRRFGDTPTGVRVSARRE